MPNRIGQFETNPSLRADRLCQVSQLFPQQTHSETTTASMPAPNRNLRLCGGTLGQQGQRTSRRDWMDNTRPASKIGRHRTAKRQWPSDVSGLRRSCHPSHRLRLALPACQPACPAPTRDGLRAAHDRQQLTTGKRAGPGRSRMTESWVRIRRAAPDTPFLAF